MMNVTNSISSAAPRVSVLILNWNGREHLPTCLNSLAVQSWRDFEVILIDNGSSDGSQEMVRGDYPWVRLVCLEGNAGFAGGNNRALECARGEYIVTLNNDTQAEPDWLAILVQVAEAHPRAGMIASRICSFADPDIIDSLGMGICRDGMARGRFRNRNWSSLRLQEVEEILFPSACAALYRREMLQGTGFFDEDFFAYAEDTDLGLRGRLAGWDALLATRAVVLHKYSQTAGGFSPLKVRLVERNHYWAAVKTFPLPDLLMLPIFTVARYHEQFRGVLKRQGTGGEFLASGSRRRILAALGQGVLEALAGLPRMLGKRRKIMKSRRPGIGDFAFLLRRYRISFSELLDHD